MSEFFSFLKTFVMCGTVFFITMTVLLALPQSKLRSVGLEMSKWALACGLLLMCPSPVDVIPDVVPLIGWGDDLAYLIAAGFTVKSALGERQRRSELEQLEFEQMMAAKRAEIRSPDAGDDAEADEKREAA
ncbi:MAG TPA: YkvA family protein [Phycisphaerae bacterium]|nr:YkvA family protein [Phycisphaerae bacterium]